MKKAFTLVEVLVTMSLVTVMLGAVLVNYQASNNRQKVLQAAAKLKQTLETAKSNAMNGKKDAAVCGTGPSATGLVGWRVVRASDTQYRIEGLCGALVFSALNINMEAGLTMSAWTSPILFKSLGQGTSLAASTTITVSGYSQTAAVTVTPAGEIQI